MKTPFKTNGFTIVELLIVIVVIGILASITIVAYNGIQDRARAAVVASDLSSLDTQLGVYYADNGQFPTTLADLNGGTGPKVSTGTTLQYSSGGTTFCTTATKGTTSYKATDTSTPTAGGCAGHGVGGIAAITNLIYNPSFETNANYWSYRWYGTAGGAGTNSRGTNGGFDGSGYLRKIWTTGGAAADNGFNTLSGTSYLIATPGTSYTLSGYMRTNRSDYGARTGITWYDSANVVIGSSVYWSGSTTLPANTWTRLSQTATAPAGAAKAIGYFSNGGSISWLAGDTLDLDATMFSEGTSAFADGGSTNWVWNGTAENSTSTGPPL